MHMDQSLLGSVLFEIENRLDNKASKLYLSVVKDEMEALRMDCKKIAVKHLKKLAKRK